MPAHIWMRTGDYVGAAKTNATAAELDEKYVKATGATGMYPTMVTDTTCSSSLPRR